MPTPARPTSQHVAFAPLVDLHKASHPHPRTVARLADTQQKNAAIGVTEKRVVKAETQARPVDNQYTQVGKERKRAGRKSYEV